MNFGVIFKELWQSWRTSLRRPGFVVVTVLIGAATDSSTPD